MTPPDWQSAIEIHPENWICPPDKFWIAGWATSATGLVPVDIRARLGPRVFLGLCGLPRPDKETAARGRAGPPQAGFSFLLSPIRNATEIRIEICDQFGRWTELFRHNLTCTGGETLPPTTQPSSLFLDLLTAKHARPREAWSSLAAEILTAANAETFDVMPSPPFHGALEQLNNRAAVAYGHLLVTGWLAHKSERITRLTAFLDTATPLPLVHGLDRPDAATSFPDLVDSARSRFAGFLRLPANLPRPLALRIFAELADGRRELVFLKRFHPVVTNGFDPDLPPYSAWTFFRAHRALRQAGWPENPSDLAAARAAYRLRAPTRRLPRPAPALPSGAAPSAVTLVTHNLNREGAPLFLLEYARYLAAQPGTRLRVISPSDGPLRADFANAGIPVTLVSAPSIDTDLALIEHAATLEWAADEVILANTLESFWAVHLAHRLRRPSLFYIHESAAAHRFFALQLPPAALARAEAAFALATRVVFLAAGSQRAHAALGAGHNFTILPGWIDIALIRAYDAAHDRAALRRHLDLPADATVIALIGSLMPRKGQHVFLEAVRQISSSSANGTSPLIFALVGARSGPDPYADVLHHTIATAPLPNVRVVAHAADAYAWFKAADICVCASLEEAFPRVVMEAAAFGRLIVSTNVNGIPEMLDASTAWLVPPDSSQQLAAALRDAIAAHQRGAHTRAERARASITARFDTAVLLPLHAALLREVAGLSAHEC